MKKVFLVAALLFMTIHCFSQTPNFQWTNGAGGIGAELGRTVVTDNLGNVYVTGCFSSSTITFDTINLTNTNPNYSDIFLVKYSSAGSVIWAKKYGGMGSDIPNSIVLDFSGNIYLVGNYTSHSIVFGADILLNADTSNFYTDLFVAKMDNNGNALWGRGAGGTKNENANSITFNNSGIYIIGIFSSDSISFGSTTLINTNADSSDIFIAKFNYSGSAIWCKSAGGINDEGASSITSDNLGNTYITGYYKSSEITFGSTTLTNAGGVDWANRPYHDMYITKYDSTGNVLIAKRYGTIGYEEGNSIVTDALGNLYVTGIFSGTTITLDTIVLTNSAISTNSKCNFFLAKYDSSLNVIWAKKAGGTDGSARAHSIAVNGSEIYLAGSFWSSTITLGTILLTNNHLGTTDLFIAKYDTTGTAIWAARAGLDNFDVANSITADPFGSIYVTGEYESGSITLGTTTLVNAFHQDGSGLTDIFLTKINGTTGINDFSINDEGLIIAPNPFTSQTTITFKEDQKNTTIKITDLNGKEIITINFKGRQLIIDRNEMKAGIYFVQTTDEKNNIANKKMIIQNH